MPERTPAEIAERRAKREARRAKQRLANVGRAAKMHAARLAFEDAAAPAKRRTSDPSHPHLAGSLASTVLGDDVSSKPTSAPPAINVGCSGWFYWHWRDAFYPPRLPTSQWFLHYAGKFGTVELNAPFYAWPTVGTVQAWLRQVGRRRFVYTVKVSELITHVKRFVGTKTLVKDFGHIADLLGPRMGCFLFQLPPSVRYSKAMLARIVSQLDPARRNVVEFRHKSWWNDEVYAAFRKAGAIFCSCSGPRLPDVLVKTCDEIYVRFHGTTKWYRHDYSKAELAVWVERIRASGATRVWAYFNNDRDGYAIKNARELVRQLNRAMG